MTVFLHWALLLVLYWAPLLGLGVSAAYFLASPKGESLGRRALCSAHGTVIALLYFSVMFPDTGDTKTGAPDALAVPFNVTVLLGLILMVLPLFLFRGSKILHLLQLLNLVLLVWTWVIGGMAVTGRYL